MKMLKGCAAIAAVGIIAAATIMTGFGGSGELDPWFVQGTFDRVNPLVTQLVAYAQPPAPDAWFDSYEDASGGGENYVYEVCAYDENGAEHKANLTSFGGELDGGKDAYLKLSVKGSYIRRWEYVAADAVPAAAARALG